MGELGWVVRWVLLMQHGRCGYRWRVEWARGWGYWKGAWRWSCTTEAHIRSTSPLMSVWTVLHPMMANAKDGQAVPRPIQPPLWLTPARILSAWHS